MSDKWCCSARSRALYPGLLISLSQSRIYESIVVCNVLPFFFFFCVCVEGGGGGGGGTRARAHASVRGATYNFGVIFRKEWSSLYSTWSWSTVLWHQTRRLIWLNLPTPKWWDFLPAASNIAWHAYITIHWCFCADTVISLLPPPPPPSFFLSWHGRSTHHRRTLFIWIIQCHLMPQW